MRAPATRPLRVAGSIAACLLLSIACSSSNEATPTRTLSPSPAGEDAGADASLDPCLDPTGCFACEPVELEDFLNACTDGSCTPFDNAARLPLYEPGKPLPPVP